MKSPNFIVIGAGKCGTTSLYDYLNQHPQVYLCPQKETYFFVPEPIRSKFKPWGAITDFSDYANLFKNADDNSVIGEISTTYYRHSGAAQQIYQTLPNVKIIAILRDPASRAFSDYQMHFRKGNEKTDFTQLISPDNRFIKPGFYYSELIPFFEIFKPQQIKILLFEDFSKNPLAFIEEFFEFIGVDTKFVPDINKKSREGGLPKNKALNTLLTQPNYFRTLGASCLSLFLPLSTRQKIRSGLIKKNIQTTKISTEARKQLLEIYHHDILQLQELIDRDLSAWLS